MPSGTLRYLALGAVVAFVLAAAWLARLPVATELLRTGLAARGFESELQVTALDFSRVVVENARLGPREDPTVVANRVEVGFRATEVFSGRLRAIRADGLAVRARWAYGQIFLDGLPEIWARRRTGQRAPAPALALSNIRIFLETPAGEVMIDGMAQGDPASGWLLEAAAEPGEISNGEASVILNEGRVQAQLFDTTATLEANVVLQDYIGPGWSIETVSLNASLNGVMPDPSRFSSLDASGPIEIRVSGAGLGRRAADERAAAMIPDGPDLVRAILGPHASALRFAISETLFDVDVAADPLVSIRDGVVDATWEAPAVVLAGGGAALTVRAGGGGMSFDVGRREIVGGGLRVDLSGGGFPEIAGMISNAEIYQRTSGDWQGDVQGQWVIQPWDVDSLAAAGQFDLARLEFDRAGWTLRAAGRVATEGVRSGAAVKGLGAAVDLVLSNRNGVVRLAANDAARQVITMQSGAGFGGSVRDVTAKIAGGGGGRPFLEIGPNGVEATALVQELDVLMARPEMAAARLRAPAAEIRFSASPRQIPRWDARMQGPRVDGQFSNQRDLRLEARVLNLGVELRETPEISALFEALTIGGTAAALSVTDAAGETRFTLDGWRLGDGRLTLARAELRDVAAAPRFAPLRIAASGDLTDGRFTGGGWAKDVATDTDLADLTFNLDINARTGDVAFRNDALEFVPGRLAPGGIVPALEPVASTVDGAVAVDGAIIRDAPGAPLVLPLRLSFGDVTMATALGPIAGLNGMVNFTDALTLQSDGQHTLSVAAYDPGAPLTDGRISVSFPGFGAVVIEDARFSLAGGSVRVRPMNISPGAVDHTGVADLENVDLAQLAAGLSTSEVTLSGLATGQAPFRLDQRSVRLEQAALAVRGGGQVALAPAFAEAIVQASPDQSRAVQSLRNFPFDTLDVVLDGDLAGWMVIALRARGSDARSGLRTTVTATFTPNLANAFANGEARRGAFAVLGAGD